jgi:hypothetical protein
MVSRRSSEAWARVACVVGAAGFAVVLGACTADDGGQRGPSGRASAAASLRLVIAEVEVKPATPGAAFAGLRLFVDGSVERYAKDASGEVIHGERGGPFGAPGGPEGPTAISQGDVGALENALGDVDGESNAGGGERGGPLGAPGGPGADPCAGSPYAFGDAYEGALTIYRGRGNDDAVHTLAWTAVPSKQGAADGATACHVEPDPHAEAVVALLDRELRAFGLVD